MVRDELWADAIFSLAIATGHSLEHPAGEANPVLGDYVETPTAQPGAYYRRYVTHEDSSSGITRVVRAVRLSDTNPPAYYVLLNLWTRATGTGDLALRAFSVLWAVLTIPVLWAIGREVGGPGTAWLASLLFAFSPVSIYYSAEGRMYSLLWFVGTLLAWTTLQLARRGPRVWLVLGWIAVGTVGLLTHYFFAFAWAAFAGWLLVSPGRMPRTWSTAAIGLTAVAVLPWALTVSESLGRWRVTAGWLQGPTLSLWQALSASAGLAWDLLAWRLIRGGPGWLVSAAALACGASILVLGRGRLGQLATRRSGLIWLWLLAACGGPVVFDLVLKTHASAVLRYALTGLPAVLVLVALALASVPVLPRAILAVLIIGAWLPAVAVIYAPRWWVGYGAVGARLEGWRAPCDVMIVHSIPSGVIAVSRYLRSEVPIASWVAPLETWRVPADLEALVAGRRRVALVKIAELGWPSPAEVWLRDHAALDAEHRTGSGQLLLFVLRPDAVDSPSVRTPAAGAESPASGDRARACPP
jgi:uncharacterized membrane protein